MHVDITYLYCNKIALVVIAYDQLLQANWWQLYFFLYTAKWLTCTITSRCRQRVEGAGFKQVVAYTLLYTDGSQFSGTDLCQSSTALWESESACFEPTLRITTSDDGKTITCIVAYRTLHSGLKECSIS